VYIKIRTVACIVNTHVYVLYLETFVFERIQLKVMELHIRKASERNEMKL